MRCGASRPRCASWGSPADVVRIRMFVTDISRWREIGAVHAEFFGDIRPAATMVEVSALIEPELLIEIEADAYGGRSEAARSAVRARDARRDHHHSADRQRAVQMREQHGLGVRWNSVFPTHRRPEPVGVDVQQHQVGTAGEEPVSRQMNLLRRGQMHESDLAEESGKVPRLGGLRSSPAVRTGGVGHPGFGYIHDHTATPATGGRETTQPRTARGTKA